MKRSNRLMLMLGVVLATVAFIGVLMFGSSSGQAGPAEKPPETIAVVTTTVAVPIGTALSAEQLTMVEVPLAEAVDTYRQPTEVQGLVVRRDLPQGAKITTRDFQTTANAAASEIVRGLQPGQRAMAIQVDPLAGLGTLIQPGDRVDVLMSVTDQDNKAPVVLPANPFNHVDDGSVNNTTVKVLVQNVQVLGVLAPPAATDGSTGPAATPATQTVAIVAVTPQQAELVRFAQIDGNLTIVLRAPGDRDAAAVETTGVTLRELVETHGVLPPRAIYTQP